MPKPESKAFSDATEFLPAQMFKKSARRLIFAVSCLTILCLGTLGFGIRQILLPVEQNQETSCDLLSANSSRFEAIFNLNLRGSLQMTYTEVKLLDVLWQLVAGSFGRLLLGWLSYQVFMDGLVRLLEKSFISYELYASAALNVNTLLTCWRTFKAVIVVNGWRARLMLLFFAVSSIFTLGFPNIISATGGYVTPSTRAYAISDGIYLNANSEQLISCMNVTSVTWDDRLDFFETIIGPPVHEDDILGNVYPTNHSLPNGTTWQELNSYYWLKKWGRSVLFAQWLHLAEVMQADGCNPERMLWYNSTNLACGDPLNSVSELAQCSEASSDQSANGNDTYHGGLIQIQSKDVSMFPVNDGAGHHVVCTPSYCDLSAAFSMVIDWDLTQDMKCQPTDYFVWGVSTTLVICVFASLIVWIIGMYAIWLDANLNSELCRRGRKLRSPFRAAADLAEAMNEVLGDKTCAYSDSQLAKALKRQPGVRYYSTRPKNGQVGHIGLSSVRRRTVKIDRFKLYGKAEWEVEEEVEDMEKMVPKDRKIA